jgi:segregation and condensation protein A
MVLGQPLQDWPKDLYVPPDALRVWLESFEGPLDLLLYLIRKNNLDILQISVFAVTQQYLEYINAMQALQLDVAADYLVMAAGLVELKSRELLPAPAFCDDPMDDINTGFDLVERLQDYAQFSQVAQALDALPRLERDVFAIALPSTGPEPVQQWQELTPADLHQLLSLVVARQAQVAPYAIAPETLSLSDKLAAISSQLKSSPHGLPVSSLLVATEGRMGVVVTFLAVLELVKMTAVALSEGENWLVLRLEWRNS